MGARGGELVATDETTLVSKSLLDVIVMEDSQGNGRFPDPPRTDESDWNEVFCETDDLPDQLVTSETGPRGLRGRLPSRPWTQRIRDRRLGLSLAGGERSIVDRWEIVPTEGW